MNTMLSSDYRTTPGSHAEITFVTAAQIWEDAALLWEWDRLTSTSSNLNVMYQSPEWLAYLHEVGQVNQVSVAVARDGAGSLLGMVPMCVHQGSVQFDVAGHNLYSMPLRKVTLLGGEPMLPPEIDIHDRFFLALDNAFPETECFIMDSLSCSSFMWRYLQESSAIRDRFLPYFINGARDYHTLPLPPTFRGYLAQFNRKKRYNLRRQLRVLRNSCEEQIELVRVESRADIDLWLEARHAIDRSQRHVRADEDEKNGDNLIARQMADLADRRLLRSYILKSANHYFGCIAGCHYRDTYNVWYTLYNQHFAKLSPGTSTFFLAIKDLFSYRPVKMVNLGFGEPRHMFTTQMVDQHTTAALFRKTPRHRLYREVHAAFRSCVEMLKHVMHGIGI